MLYCARYACFGAAYRAQIQISFSHQSNSTKYNTAMVDAPQLDAAAPAAAVGAKRPLEPVVDESNKLPRIESSGEAAIKVLAAATAAMASAEAAPSSQPQATSETTTTAAPKALSQEPASSVAAAAADTADAATAATSPKQAAVMPANPAAAPIASQLTAGEKACLARVELPAEVGTRLVVLWQLEVEGVDREEWWPCTLQRSQEPRQDSHNRAVFELHYEAANGCPAEQVLTVVKHAHLLSYTNLLARLHYNTSTEGGCVWQQRPTVRLRG
jgi:hypothetical protein